MQNKRLLTAGGIIGVIVLALFGFSVPRTNDASLAGIAEETNTHVVPEVSFQDAFKKGIHVITGSVKAPDACATVAAQAFFDASSTPASISVALTMSPTSGICLQVPSYATFSVSVAAPKDTPVVVTINGAAIETSQ